jgi:hypothetical protein
MPSPEVSCGSRDDSLFRAFQPTTISRFTAFRDFFTQTWKTRTSRTEQAEIEDAATSAAVSDPQLLHSGGSPGHWWGQRHFQYSYPLQIENRKFPLHPLQETSESSPQDERQPVSLS